jgi:hypothetical protein
MNNQYQNKPAVIEAVQWHTHGDHPAVRQLADSDDMHLIGMGGATLKLPACRAVYGVIGPLDSPKNLVMPGDWIIKNGADSYYPLAPDVFEAAYEACPIGTEDDRAAWSTRQWAEHVGAWEDKASQVCFGSWMAIHAMLLQFQAMTVRELAAGGTAAALDVLTERRRQVEAEGWTEDQDDAHEGGELAQAAICYADPAAHCQLGIPHQWPWVAEWWKPRDRRRNLVRAGALVIAEIERLDRAAEQTGKKPE